jgi:hypothetical protein
MRTTNNFLIVASQDNFLLWNLKTLELVETCSISKALPESRSVGAVSEICVASHVHLAAGFCTLHHNTHRGSTLLYWKKQETDWSVASIIALPLSSSLSRPRVCFDGQRLVVYGKDHIGLIVLVYGVTKAVETQQELSGGVYNLIPSLEFAQRIRHAALDGLEPFELQLSVNERFLVLNTRACHQLVSNVTDGLLVIDLES